VYKISIFQKRTTPLFWPVLDFFPSCKLMLLQITKRKKCRGISKVLSWHHENNEEVFGMSVKSAHG
jgi:hypothetical protein